MNERGDALLETVLIAPVLLLMGLLATEFGISALRRSQLSESIRSTINFELINAKDSEVLQDGRLIEFSLKEKLKNLPSLDEARQLEVEVKLSEPNEGLEVKLPFLSLQGESILANRPKNIEVHVRAYSKPVFKTFLTLPPLEDVVKYHLRGEG